MFLVNNDTRSVDNDPYWLLIKLMLHLVVVSGEFYSFDVFIHYNAWEKASSKKWNFIVIYTKKILQKKCSYLISN